MIFNEDERRLLMAALKRYRYEKKRKLEEKGFPQDAAAIDAAEALYARLRETPADADGVTAAAEAVVTPRSRFQ